MKKTVDTLKLILTGLILTAAFALIVPGCSRENLGEDEVNGMNRSTVKIPPIDEITPADIETATFALG
ncbi:MAG: hypothetical protein JXA46_19385 [Dehalococcoidales bacterium]|nr:hypothetical protein [Dehalococcoidales bacterium]